MTSYSILPVPEWLGKYTQLQILNGQSAGEA